MKIYIFNYLDEKGNISNQIATACKETIDYSIEFANKRNWNFSINVFEIKTQGKNFHQFANKEKYYELPF